MLDWTDEEIKDDVSEHQNGAQEEQTFQPEKEHTMKE